MGIQVCLIPWMSFDYKENGGKKSFSCKSKASILRITMKGIGLYANKKMEIIMSIQVCLISRINFYYKENGGNKNFSFKSKA